MKRNYTILFLLGGVFLTAGCSNETAEPQIETNEPTISETSPDEPELSDMEALSETEEAVIADENWQITDYVRHLHGEKVVESNEDLEPMNGVNWFYQTLDVKGGYASITGAVEGWKEYVIWRMKDGNDLVGELSVGCGPACSYDFSFYEGVGSQIEMIETNEIIPVDELMGYANDLQPKALKEYPLDYEEDMQLVYVFPQKGTGMQVDLVLGADELRIKLADLSWDKEKFSVKSHETTVQLIAG
jgi:hypothetical protein